MYKNLVILFLLFTSAVSYGQIKFTTDRQNVISPQLSFEYSNKWKEVYKNSNSIKISIQDSLISNIGLDLTVNGKLYNYDSGGFSMELAALQLFNFPTIEYDSIEIAGRKGIVLTNRNFFKSEERIIRDIVIDFPQYSMLQIHISGSNKLFAQNTHEIESIISSMKISESQIPQPQVIISQEVYEEGIGTNYERFVNDSILSKLFLNNKFVIGNETEIEDLVDFFEWKRSSKDSLTKFENNNLLLFINWLDFTEISMELDKKNVTMNFFVNKVNILTLTTQLEDPVFVERVPFQNLNLFYIDYRKRMVMHNGTFVLDDKTKKRLEAPYILVNGKVYPFSTGKIYWN